MNPVTSFTDKSKDLSRNPLGIIALFISLLYGFVCLVLGTGINNLKTDYERVPLIWFIIIFPFATLGTFAYLVIYHHKKLYGPSDYKDEENFIKTIFVDSRTSYAIEGVQSQIKSLKEHDKSPEDYMKIIDTISADLQRIQDDAKKIQINSLWNLNHWGGDYVKIENDRFVFSGISGKEADGAHINLYDRFELDHIYEISCFAKSDDATTGKFQLWCTDPKGKANVSTVYRTPSTTGETIKLFFTAASSRNVRIHLQYQPGIGRIEISDIRVFEVPK